MTISMILSIGLGAAIFMILVLWGLMRLAYRHSCAPLAKHTVEMLSAPYSSGWQHVPVIDVGGANVQHPPGSGRFVFKNEDLHLEIREIGVSNPPPSDQVYKITINGQLLNALWSDVVFRRFREYLFETQVTISKEAAQAAMQKELERLTNDLSRY